MLDIKLKKFSRAWYMKLVAFVVMIGCIAGFFAVGINSIYNDEIKNPSSLFTTGKYEESPAFTGEVNLYLNSVLDNEYRLKNELYINEGKTITAEQIKDKLNIYYNQWRSSNGRMRFEYNENAYWENSEYYTSNYINGFIDEYTSEDYDENGNFIEKTKKLTYEEFLKENPELEDQVKQILIQDDLATFRNNQRHIKKNVGFEFKKVTKDGDELSDFKDYPVYFSYIDGKVNSNNDAFSQAFQYWKNTKVLNPNTSFIIGLPANQLAKLQAQSDNDHNKMVGLTKKLSILFGVVVLTFLYLCIVTGRKPEDEEVHLNFVDRIWSEIQWFIGIMSVIAAAGLLVESSYYYSDLYGSMKNSFLWFLAGVATLLMAVVSILCFSQIRRLKKRQWLKGFIICRFIRKLWKGVLALWHGGKLMNRMVVIAVAVPLLSATWIGTPFMIVLLLFLSYRYVTDFVTVCEGVKKVRNGELNHIIMVKNEGDIKDLAENINSLSNGLEHAVSSELRSERLKTELISNVSHDIKTPLTSIITYVDLLKQEEIENDAAKDYIDVIDRKSQRLKVLTTDLFDAAKASSGDMPVNFERVDFNALIRQGLGEFEDRIVAADLTMKVNLPEQPMYMRSDGKLMWRVLDNLLSNIIKYAQSGSRVYIEVNEEVETKSICFTIKNISAFELNIDADELMQRFTRGDESRSSEGSGLGLNIANSLVELQHGQFKLEIDGDLFKVMIWMPKYEEEITV